MTESKSRISRILLVFALVFSAFGVTLALSGTANKAYAADGDTVLAFTSDVHNGTAVGSETNVSANRLVTWLGNVQPKYNNAIEVMGFCGDMAAASSNQSTFWTFTQTVMDKLDERNIEGVYAVGNHEYMNGQFASTSNSPEVRGKYKLNEEGRAVAGESYVMYCLGTNSSHGTSWAYDDSQITQLTNYLNGVGNDKVIIILTHFPLHNYGSHRTSNTLPVLNAINEAAAGADGTYGTSDDKKIVFLWGHNHSEGDTNYDEVWFPGDTINDNDKSTVNFFYAAAGSMADSEYGSSGRVLGKGLVLEINSQKQLSFTYYNADGNNVTEPSGETRSEVPKEPVAIQGVTITNSNPTVKVGKSLQLKYSTTPSDATVDSVSWSSSNTGVATVNSSGKVTGEAEGTATITVSVSDGLSKAVKSAEIEVNVTAAGGSEEHTVSITPSTSNPEQTISIEVGDTLVINTTNGSSNSAYDFTASLSKSGIAELQGNATQNIAAGASAAFTFEGVGDGTVDITIQNSNTYGSQYARKATIHLTVGSGTTPIEPQSGDTVNITPSTDNPEESIKIEVGDTLTINVTNGSSNSAYDFTASLSKSGVAKLTSNSTVNIASGGTGTFTVEGVTDGTVDITIQNSNTYGSQYVRKGVIHLTVGEGGDTPVDPPTGDTVNITPTTDNPEESIKIAVGDTLTINVTNGSSNSAYDFTASLSKDGVAEIQGNSTVNIAAGGTGTFTVKGLADGTVDITIQNSNTYGSQYARKGVIHLTVGEGGTGPIPTGDTVNITPTTDNPEKAIQIAVGDTLTINVTNGSSNSAYDFTASLSKSGIVELQGNATVNISAGATAQYAVKGLAEGTVDVTIQNENSYGSQYVRKGVVHVTVVDEGAAHEHTWDAGTVTTEATCTTTGVKTYTCTGCGETKTEAIPALGHAEETIPAVAATCTTAGKTAGTKCSRCGEVLVAQQEIAPLGHNVVVTPAVPATCTEPGMSEGQTCSRCGEVLVAPTTIPALGHSFGDWVVTKAATCTETGEETRTCSRCGEKETREIAMIAHAWGEGVVTTMPSCEEPGVATQTCSVCGATQTFSIGALGHIWGDPTYTWNEGEDGMLVSLTASHTCKRDPSHVESETVEVVVTENVPANETEEGYITYSSKDFKDPAFRAKDKTVPLPATGHDLDYDNVVFSWTGDDFSGYTAATATVKCKSGDGYEVTVNALVSAQTKDATCTEAGQTVYTASAVFEGGSFTETKTVEIPTLGHKPGNPTVENVVAATCTEAGSYELNTYCTVCGEKLSSETVAVEALGHSASEPVMENVVAAGCTEAGSYELNTYCTACGEKLSSETVAVEALGHDFGAWRPVIPATCTEAGSEARYCSRCSASETREVAALGHKWDAGKVTKEATSTTAGVKTFTCETCGETRTEAIPTIDAGSDPKKMGEDGTAVGPGASAAAAEAAILGMTSDGDPKGTNYLPLELKSKKQAKNSITISWAKQPKAAKYVVYGNLCGKKYKMAKIATVSGSKASKVIKKIAGKKLKAGKAYKLIVVALDKDNLVVSTSKLIHVNTKGGKNTNHKTLTIKQGSKVVKSLAIAKGSKATIKATGVKADSKLGYSAHVAVRYCSSSAKVCKVNKKGVISAKKAGTCYVYAYSQNGVNKKIKVTVK